MLRVSYSDNAGVQRWRLCGRLAGPWVNEFASSWHHARQRAPLAQAVVDLTDVTFVDEAGQRLLAEIEYAGAEFLAGGVENKHLIACLSNKEIRRSLRRGLESLCSDRAERTEPNRGEK